MFEFMCVIANLEDYYYNKSDYIQPDSEVEIKDYISSQLFDYDETTEFMYE